MQKVIKIDEDVYNKLAELAKKDSRSIANFTSTYLRGRIIKAKGLKKTPKGLGTKKERRGLL